MRVPERPKVVPPEADACLSALAARGLGARVSIGGAFGLAHYHEYRTTHDVDAWWVEPAGAEAQREVVEAIEAALRPFGEPETRSWGDVVSVTVRRADKREAFSFQIARRSVLLEPPLPSAWTSVRLDSFPDLLASKMTALVERGAPRDFRDVHEVCRVGLADVVACWDLWSRRGVLAGDAPDRARAALAIRSHLARLERARPLTGIDDPADRARAEAVRAWVREELLHEPPA